MAKKKNDDPLAAGQDAMIREVEDQVKLERRREFWKKHGNRIIGMALAALVAAALYEGGQSYRRRVAYGASDEYLAALFLYADNRPDEASAMFERIAAEDKNGLSYFAKINEILLKHEKGGMSDRALLELAQSPKMFAPAADYLRIAYAYRMVDSKDKDEIFAVLKPLEGRPAFEGAVGEIKALSLIKAGDRGLATSILEGLMESKTLNAAAKNRIRSLMQAIGK